LRLRASAVSLAAESGVWVSFVMGRKDYSVATIID
jgi:hypothetical protein